MNTGTHFYTEVSFCTLVEKTLPDQLAAMTSYPQLASSSRLAEPRVAGQEASSCHLPGEILSNIFCELSLYHFAQTRAVCRRWKAIENDRCLSMIAQVALAGRGELNKYNSKLQFLLNHAMPPSVQLVVEQLKSQERSLFVSMLFKIGCLEHLKMAPESYLDYLFESVKVNSAQGCDKSSFLLGLFYLNDKSFEGSVDAAIELFRRATETDADGCINYLVAQIYQDYDIYGLPEDQALRMKYLKTAAEKELPLALCALAEVGMAVGERTEEQKAESFKYLSKAWSLGCVRAAFHLYVCYRDGLGVPKDLPKAAAFVVEGASKNAMHCMFELGFNYQEGLHGFERDSSKAIKYYKQAADRDNVEALSKLCVFYAQGMGVPQDKGKAAEYFNLFEELVRERIQKHDSWAPYLRDLAKFYEEGIGVPSDLDMAMFLFDLGCERGFKPAAYHLGTYYEAGDFVPQDAVKMIQYYQCAADDCYAPALFKLCQLYSQGFDVTEPDLQLANHYFNLLNNGKFAIGRPLAVAFCYALGFGTEIDAEKSIAYFHIAADKENFAIAQFKLCLHYASLGDDETAKIYFQALSYELHPHENYRIKERYLNISYCYAQGVGVDRDLNKASHYAGLAAAMQTRFVPDSYL